MIINNFFISLVLFDVTKHKDSDFFANTFFFAKKWFQLSKTPVSSVRRRDLLDVCPFFVSRISRIFFSIGFAEKSTRKSNEKSKEKILKNERMRECILVDDISKESRRKGVFAPPAQGENSSTPLLRRKFPRSQGEKEGFAPSAQGGDFVRFWIDFERFLRVAHQHAHRLRREIDEKIWWKI